MFNQRPTSLLGLEPRHDSSTDLINFLSPMLTSPDEYIRYLDYLFKAEKLQQESLAASTPTSGDQNSLSSHMHLQQQQQQQQQEPQQQLHQLQPQIQPPIPSQLQPQLQQQLQPQIQPQLQPLLQQQQLQPQLQPNLQPLQLQQLQPPQHHVGYQALPSMQLNEQHYQQLQPQIRPAPIPANDSDLSINSSGPKNETESDIDVARSDSCRSQMTVSSEQSQVVAQRPTTLNIKANIGPSEREKAKLTEEERIRNKRERNRRAAANCRRRKDEKLKRLEDENTELRKQIANLQSTIDKLRRGTNSTDV